MAFEVIRKTTIISTDSLLTLANAVRQENRKARLNARAGFKEFEITTPDNGAHIIIKRNKQ